MATAEKTLLTTEATIDAPVDKVWDYWTNPKHIIRWNSASPDWHTPYSKNDIREGGRFMSRMEARDGSMGFDFGGIYTRVKPHEVIEYTMDDDRKVFIVFTSKDNSTHVRQQFEAETENSGEMQREGWQAILNNFKKYVENDSLELLEFSATINAPVEKVYTTMIADDTYRQWTSIFNSSSHYIGSWNKGDKLHFIGIEDGKKGGMVSRVKENKPNEFISIEHIGLLEGDEEITSGDKVKGWAGALENYTFKSNGDKTLVEVDMDSNKEFKNYFIETWPKALEKLKEICEK